MFSPRKDSEKVYILGSLFRSWRPDTLEVSVDGSPKHRGTDFIFNEDWGQIANLDNRLGEPRSTPGFNATIQIALSRLDLVQQTRSGERCVKRGKSALVCPKLPSPDESCTAVAGVFISPGKLSRHPALSKADDHAVLPDSYGISHADIFPIDPAPFPALCNAA